MRAACADEDLDVRSAFFSVNLCAEEVQQSEKTRGVAQNLFSPGCGLAEHLTDDIGRRYEPDIRQHIQHLFIRQLAAKAVHGAE